VIGRLVVWVLFAGATLGLVLFALGHALVVLLLGLGAMGYALLRRRVGG